MPNTQTARSQQSSVPDIRTILLAMERSVRDDMSLFYDLDLITDTQWTTFRNTLDHIREGINGWNIAQLSQQPQVLPSREAIRGAVVTRRRPQRSASKGTTAHAAPRKTGT